MADVFSIEKRSRVISRIKGKDTVPEIIVRRYLREHGFGYRKNVRSLPGCPDIVLTKYKSVIFVNGCFWHGHDNCKYFVVPKTRTDWWIAKINRTKQKDEEACKQLTDLGWHVYTIWECEIEKNQQAALNKITGKLKESNRHSE
jgi:DNA mismatch endonuclease (patch repair protein)